MSSTSVSNQQTKKNNNHDNIYNSNGSPCKRKLNTNNSNGVSHSEMNRKVAFSVRRSKPIRSKTIIDNMMANSDNSLKQQQHHHHHHDTSVNHHEIPQISTYSLGSIELKKKPCGAKKRKIKIEFIEDKTKRNVTFSKRKTGLLKKAFELSAMSESQILALVVSETGNVFSYATDDLLPLLNEEEFRTAIKACLESPASATASATVTQNKTSSLKSVSGSLRKKNKRDSESDTDYIDCEVNEGEESYMSLSDTDSN